MTMLLRYTDAYTGDTSSIAAVIKPAEQTELPRIILDNGQELDHVTSLLHHYRCIKANRAERALLSAWSTGFDQIASTAAALYCGQ